MLTLLCLAPSMGGRSDGNLPPLFLSFFLYIRHSAPRWRRCECDLMFGFFSSARMSETDLDVHEIKTEQADHSGVEDPPGQLFIVVQSTPKIADIVSYLTRVFTLELEPLRMLRDEHILSNFVLKDNRPNESDERMLRLSYIRLVIEVVFGHAINLFILTMSE